MESRPCGAGHRPAAASQADSWSFYISCATSNDPVAPAVLPPAFFQALGQQPPSDKSDGMLRNPMCEQTGGETADAAKMYRLQAASQAAIPSVQIFGVKSLRASTRCPVKRRRGAGCHLVPPIRAGSATERVWRKRRQMADLIVPLFRIGSRPHHHQDLDHGTDRLKLRDDEDARALFAALEAVSEMHWHCPSIMRDENAILSSGDLEDLRVAQSGQTALRR